MLWDDLEPLDERVGPAPSSVLVAVVPSLKDWERIQRERWYRIPLKRAPRQIGAEYLAFYHPGCFGDLRWSIRSYAAIQRYSLAPRRALLPEEGDHPRAGDLYYRLDLGPLQTLPHPVYSRRIRRVTFIHTDLETLSHNKIASSGRTRTPGHVPTGARSAARARSTRQAPPDGRSQQRGAA